MAEGSRPPQFALMASAAGGGFAGALIAIVIAKILMGSCCCCHDHGRQAADAAEPAATEAVVAHND